MSYTPTVRPPFRGLRSIVRGSFELAARRRRLQAAVHRNLVDMECAGWDLAGDHIRTNAMNEQRSLLRELGKVQRAELYLEGRSTCLA